MAGMKAATVVGDVDRPLILAFHGLGQHVCGWRSWWPYWDYMAMSGLRELALDWGWSLWAPQSDRLGHDWRKKDGDLIWSSPARIATGSRGPLIVTGFSDGATLAHRVAARLKPAGLVAYSGLWHGDVRPTEGAMRVVIAYDSQDIDGVRRAGVDAAEAYFEANMLLKVKVGAAGGHRIDKDTLREALEWAAG